MRAEAKSREPGGPQELESRVLEVPRPTVPPPRRSDRTVVLAGRYGLIHLTGELDVATAPDIRDAVRESLTGRPALLRIDISGVSFCDCSGLGTLLWAKAEAERAGAGFHLSGPIQPAVARVLDATGTTAHLGLTPQSAERCRGQGDGAGGPRPPTPSDSPVVG
ncbi:STAS domain-containing protein [Streptomyces sp. NPDC054958]